jgi:phage baseplate assembly protein W
MATLFKGFSTVDKNRAPYTLTDTNLIKRDLLNHFYTKRGERIMRPNFGSIIWDMLMEQDSPTLQEDIKDDIKRIVDLDPRVTLENTILYINDQTIRAEVEVKYYNLDQAETLFLEFDRRNAEDF